MSPWTVLAILGGAVLALAVFLLVRPRFVAASLVRRPATRSTLAAQGEGPGSWRVLFVITVQGLPARCDALRAALSREKEASDVLRGLLVRCLTEALAERGAGFSGTADAELLQATTAALQRVGLRLERLSLIRALRLDDRLARLARYQADGAVRGAYQGRCAVLELYIDGISGLGEWSVDTYETGRNRLTDSRQLVRNEASELEVIRPPSTVAAYRSLASMMDED